MINHKGIWRILKMAFNHQKTRDYSGDNYKTASE